MNSVWKNHGFTMHACSKYVKNIYMHKVFKSDCIEFSYFYMVIFKDSGFLEYIWNQVISINCSIISHFLKNQEFAMWIIVQIKLMSFVPCICSFSSFCMPRWLSNYNRSILLEYFFIIYCTSFKCVLDNIRKVYFYFKLYFCNI